MCLLVFIAAVLMVAYLRSGQRLQSGALEFAYLDVRSNNGVVIASAGSPAVNVTKIQQVDLNITSFVYSPNYAWVAIEGTQRANARMLIVSAQQTLLFAQTRTSIVVPICDDAVCSAPSWDFQSRWLAYEVSPANHQEQAAIWLFDTLTGSSKPLLGDKANGLRSPNWSPADNKLATFDPVRSQIVIVDLNANTRTIIPTKSGEFTAWSTTGQRLACVLFDFSSELGLYRLAVADMGVGTVIPMTDPSPNPISSITWEPNSAIAFAQLGPGAQPGTVGQQVWLADPATRTVRQITHETGVGYGGLKWLRSTNTILAVKNRLTGIPLDPAIWSINTDTLNASLVALHATQPANLVK